MLSNIARIVKNISLIIYYKSMDKLNTFVDYLREWIKDFHHIHEQDDEETRWRKEYMLDVYDFSEVSSLNRNKWGLPTK